MRSMCRVCTLALAIGCEPREASSPPPPATSGGDASSEASGSASASSEDTTVSTGANDTIEGGTGGGTTTGGEAVPRFLHYIRANPYPRLVLEVDHVEGRAPYPEAIDGIEQVFGEILDKPGGVEVVLDDVIPASAEPDPGWSSEALRSIATESFDLPVPENTVKIHVLVLDGHVAGEGSTIFGLAWDHLHIALFRDLYDAACADALIGPLQQPLCEQTEFLVWQHEVGHTIGLVDAGLPMVTDHRSPDRGPHDIDTACVMYADYEGADAVAALVDRLLSGAPPVRFDQHCLDDIDAAR